MTSVPAYMIPLSSLCLVRAVFVLGEMFEYMDKSKHEAVLDPKLHRVGVRKLHPGPGEPRHFRWFPVPSVSMYEVADELKAAIAEASVKAETASPDA